MPANAQPLAHEVLDVIPSVMRTIRKNLRDQRDPDMTLPEFRGLAFINRNPGCSLNEAAEHIGLEPPSASKLVDHLVRRGLVRRETDPADRRRVQLTLLPRGQRNIDLAFEHTRTFLAQQLEHLKAGERETVMKAMAILKTAFAAEQSSQR
jgi:DNA-binding MarR family transcriptional regulator